jgi:rod shape-determining protein MreD
MRTVVAVVLATAIGLVLQSTALNAIPGGAPAPDILLILGVYLGLRRHSVAGAFGAFVLGYVQDSFSGTAVGLNAAAMCFVYITIYLTSRRLWVDNLVSKVVVVFLASLVKTVVVTVLSVVFVAWPPLSSAMMWTLLLQAMLSAACGPLVLRIVEGAQQPDTETD